MSKKKKADPEKKLALQKMLVGHFIEEIPENYSKKIAYVWQGNGVWEARKLPLGTFLTHIHKFEVPGLKRTYEEGWTLNVPKIPATLLDITLSFFREIYDKHSSEVFLQYFYDVEKEAYSLHCPQQTVGPGSVNYKRDTDYERGKILVFEIHSHGSMGAFFSGTDDADEKDDRFFGVIGKVKQYYPELKIRLSVGGRRQEIDVEDIFDLDESNYHKESFPAEWVSRIKEKKVKVVQRSRSRHMRPRNRSGGVYYPVDSGYPGDGGFPPHNHYGPDVDEQLSIFEDDEIEPIPYATGISNDQKLIEKGGKVYVVTDTGIEEIWEEIETTEQEAGNGKYKNDSRRSAEEDPDAPEVLGHWRDIKW